MLLFDETATGKLLQYYFENPKAQTHLRDIAKKAGISAASASIICKKLLNEGFLEKKKIGNSAIYSLSANNNCLKRLKVAWFLQKIIPLIEGKFDERVYSVCLFGSFAAGEYDEKSDVDILVISDMGKKDVFAAFSQARKKLKNDLSIKILGTSEWKKIKDEKSRFYIELIAKHVVLFGNGLV